MCQVSQRNSGSICLPIRPAPSAATPRTPVRMPRMPRSTLGIVAWCGTAPVTSPPCGRFAAARAGGVSACSISPKTSPTGGLGQRPNHRLPRPGEPTRHRNSEGRAMFSDAQIASLEGDLAEHHVKRGGGPVNQCATSRAGTPSPRPTESSASAAGPARRSSSSSSGAASARSTPRRRGPARDTPAATSPASASPCWARACAFCATAQESATAPTITRARRMRAPSSRPRRTPPSGRSLPSAARSGWRSTANRWRLAGRRQKRPPSGRRRPRDRRGDGGGVRSR